MPAGQLVHEVEPVFAAKVAAEQFVHARAESTEYRPTAQEEQLDEPSIAAYVPAEQEVHKFDDAPALGRMEPTAQATQLDWPVAG